MSMFSGRDIKKRWLFWNAKGVGQERSWAEGRYRYNGPVLYSWSWPVSRIVMAGKRVVILHKSLILPSVKDSGGIVWKDLKVPDIGVFSALDGDWLPDNQLHERSQWVCFKEASELVERAHQWPVNKLMNATGQIEGAALYTELGKIAERHDAYSVLFKLDWDDFPKTRFINDIATAIKGRQKAYFDPRNVEQRARQKARREAAKLLGVDDETT